MIVGAPGIIHAENAGTPRRTPSVAVQPAAAEAVASAFGHP